MAENVLYTGNEPTPVFRSTLNVCFLGPHITTSGPQYTKSVALEVCLFPTSTHLHVTKEGKLLPLPKEREWLAQP